MAQFVQGSFRYKELPVVDFKPSDCSSMAGTTQQDTLFAEQLRCFLQMDRTTRPLSQDYINLQSTTLSDEDRDREVAWLADFCEQNHLADNRWHMAFARAVDIIDRYISSAFVHETSLHLLTMVAFFISYKVDDDQGHEILTSSLLPLLPNCTGKEILHGELEILDRLEWNVDRPTPQHFVLMALFQANLGEQVLAEVYDAANRFIMIALSSSSLAWAQSSVIGTAALMCALTYLFKLKRSFTARCPLSYDQWVEVIYNTLGSVMNHAEMVQVDDLARFIMIDYYASKGVNVKEEEEKQTPNDSGDVVERERDAPPTPQAPAQ
ncbi:Cyclin, N-terminal domain [Carpediemonas membranifera]|uniref:Cyclin, N-terminal domain n=1 Tax=Carpediemonas membranifera TaxID=201153 RepID=A0A8J6BVV8_9EUKA|nr:Cyclin, N-terminal domain [Carpediemonas membranifera]|eukprot:KAG9391806.1 Cyclin, N-terminal domain [Carpediemonas membranifera]